MKKLASHLAEMTSIHIIYVTFSRITWKKQVHDSIKIIEWFWFYFQDRQKVSEINFSPQKSQGVKGSWTL